MVSKPVSDLGDTYPPIQVATAVTFCVGTVHFMGLSTIFFFFNFQVDSRGSMKNRAMKGVLYI